MKTKLRIVSVYVVANIFVKRSTEALIEICSTYIDNTFEERGPASACRKKTSKGMKEKTITVLRDIQLHIQQ
jgi:hypothetical protein